MASCFVSAFTFLSAESWISDGKNLIFATPGAKFITSTAQKSLKNIPLRCTASHSHF